MLQVHGIEAFEDNYIWVVSDGSDRVVIIDPGDAEPVFAYLRENKQQAVAILITHGHDDHTGGVDDLKKRFPDIAVYGPGEAAVCGLDGQLQSGGTVAISGLTFKPEVLDVPGHTRGHVAYFSDGILFCGDTLFGCGCGRVFSGTMSQLYQSLGKISGLPGETLVYCAHEYTLDNIGFAKWVEPDNPDLIQREKQVKAARQRQLPTVPSTLEIELRTNPFLRVDEQQVIDAAESYAGHSLDTPEAVFTVLRQWKDRDYD